jgi:poly-gamma-glutamate capsule biosynthesis protein CapA/YwtB (metallophosphatase superfamily)
MKTVLLILLVLIPALFIPKSSPVKPQLTFTVAGDAMFGRMVSQTYPGDSLYQVLAKVHDPHFFDVNASLLNLEGPISESPVVQDLNPTSLVFNFPPQTVAALKYLGVKGVSLANNHTGNAGLSGLETTRRLLSASGIKTIGGPALSDFYQIATFSGELLNLVVIGINTFTGTPDLSGLIGQIKSDHHNRVLIFPHWGVEYSAAHTSLQQQLAHNWIDAGADLVVGSHPHVVEDSEIYKGKPIYYSLGNLVFDQNFSDQTQNGLVLTGKFTDTGLTITPLPVKLTKYQPAFVPITSTPTFFPN